MNQVSNHTKLRRLQARILSRKGLVCCGDEFTAALHNSGRAVFVGANRYGQGDIIACEGVSTLAAASSCAVALRGDGTLCLPASADPHLGDLSHVRSVSCSDTHIAALLGNGRVVVGSCGTGRKAAAADTSEWPDLEDVVCGKSFTAGLTSEGHVLVAGGTPYFRRAVSRWSGVAGLFADLEGEHLYAVTGEGRLLSTARLSRAVRSWRNLVYVAASGRRIMGVTATGYLRSTCPIPFVSDEKALFVACAVSARHAVALTRDGRVLATGEGELGQCDTKRFGVLFESFDEFLSDRNAAMQRMIADEKTYQIRLVEASRYGKRMVCGHRISACIAADGRVLASPGLSKARQWSSVRALACGNAHLVALREGGLVYADGNDTDGCTDVSEWSRIKCVSAGKYHTLGVTEDGRVLFCGRNDRGQGNVSDWNGIRRVYAADAYTVGLGYDGTLRIAGQPPFDPGIIDEYWKDPTDVVVTDTHMAALFADGSVLSTVTVPAEERLAVGEICDTHGFRGIRTVAAGHGFTVGLSYGGRVVAAGDNTSVIKAVREWSDVVAVSCGWDYVIGLTSEGRVLSAGALRVERKVTDLFQTLQSTDGYTREMPDTHGWRDVLAIQAGPDHALAMTREGTILATGLDSDGQCASTAHFTLFRDSRQLYGYGKYRKLSERGVTAEPETSPQARTSVDDTIMPFARISAHLRADTQELLSCLSGDDRYLTVCTSDGDATREITYCYETAERTAATLDYLASRMSVDHEAPAALPDGWKHAVSVLSSGAHTVALFEDGHVEAMGQNERGECRTEDWYHVIQIAVMSELTLGLRADGRVLAAGRHHAVLNTLDTVRAIACFGTCRQVFVMADGSVRIHIRGSEFLPESLGDIRVFTPSVENSVLRRYTPDSHPVDTARSALGSFALGMVHSLTLDGDGAVTATGVDDCGQCGVASYGEALQVAAGPYHSAAILADGSIVITGRGSDGRCDHRTLNRERDTVGASTEDSIHGASAQTGSRSVLQSHTWLQVACGHEHTVALRSDGRVFAVGANPDGRCNTRKWRDVQYVACGVRHTVALRADGTCVATGDNRYGQCDLSLWKNIVLVAAGEFHTVGLRADGRLEVAGDNRKGQCHVGDLRDVISVACLPEATLCVRADGRVVMRGGDGELDKAVEALREVVAIHTCEHQVAALTVDRRVIRLP
ncbi:MAG: hypothetical protein IKM33_04775 [Clostridia bacterium]|nr:hypothetical protein [Clostridia bacterium]